jgi:hypothetical protein
MFGDELSKNESDLANDRMLEIRQVPVSNGTDRE